MERSPPMQDCLLREVSRGTGLIALTGECFRDHRDTPLIEHHGGGVVQGQRTLPDSPMGYGSATDHDQLRHRSDDWQVRLFP